MVQTQHDAPPPPNGTIPPDTRPHIAVAPSAASSSSTMHRHKRHSAGRSGYCRYHATRSRANTIASAHRNTSPLPATGCGPMDSEEMVQTQHDDAPPRPNGTMLPDHTLPSPPRPPLPPPPFIGINRTMLVDQSTAATMQPGLEPTQLPVHTGNIAPLPVTGSGGTGTNVP